MKLFKSNTIKIMNTLFKNWWMVALKGLLLLLFGLFAITRPESAIMTLVTYAGIVSLIAGIFLILTALANTNKKGWGWTLAEGIFDIVFGGIILTYPFGSAIASAIIFSIFIGFWALLGGFSLIGNAFRIKKDKGSRWGIILLGGILTTILGWVIISNPLSNSIALTVLIGVFAMLFGVATIIFAFELKSMKQKLWN